MTVTSGRPCVWATAQYLSYAPTGSTLDIEVILAVTGRSATQARAICRSRKDGAEILTVNAALGHRDLDIEGEWAVRPDVPPPDQCPQRQMMPRGIPAPAPAPDLDAARGHDHGPHRRPRRRWAPVRRARRNHQRGRPIGHVGPAARRPRAVGRGLAVFGDFVPSGISQALGARAGGSSLDNTLRMVRIVPTEWVLIDLRIQAVHRGFGHGIAHLWAEDGTLLATASQSAVVRFWPGPPG